MLEGSHLQNSMSLYVACGRISQGATRADARSNKIYHDVASFVGPAEGLIELTCVVPELARKTLRYR